MLLNLNYIVPAFKLKIKGVMHIGAHTAEERNIYKGLDIQDVLWFEGNPDIYDNLCKIIEPYPNNKAYNYLLSNSCKKAKFYITNHKQSSSILPLDLHKEMYPEIQVVEERDITTLPLHYVVEKEDINMEKFNMLCLDVQGEEFEVIKGAIPILNRIDYIYTEVNTIHLYKDCPLLEDMDGLLEAFGFYREIWSLTKKGWGDALYIKKNEFIV